MVANALEPLELLAGEDPAEVLLLQEPRREALADELRVGHELVVAVDRDAYE